MGSASDLGTMRKAADILESFGVVHDVIVSSAHRTPDETFAFAASAAEKYAVIIAGAGGAAHLAGVIAAKTTLPVIGVPIKSDALNGLDSLLSTVQMPGGVPVATMAIGDAGAKNAALFAVAILALEDAELTQKLKAYRAAQAKRVMESQPES